MRKRISRIGIVLIGLAVLAPLRSICAQEAKPAESAATVSAATTPETTVPAAVPAAAVPATGSPAAPAARDADVNGLASRPVMIVHEFSVGERVGLPYDMRQLQAQTTAELRAKAANHMDILSDAPVTPRTHTYTLDGEVIAWHPGNRAKRFMIGMGSGRENAEIHYWLTDEQGKRVFEHKDTVRAEFWGNEYAGSVGELAHPFASKIASRLSEAKLP